MPGISPAVQWRVREITTGGADDALRAARAGLPYLHRRLLELGAVTSAEAALLFREFAVLTLADLEAALPDDRLARLPAATSGRLAQAIQALGHEIRALNLGRAWDTLEHVAETILAAAPQVTDLVPAGDARRFEPLVHGLVLVGSAADPAAALAAICAAPGIEDVLSRTARRALFLVHSVEIDLRIAAPDEYGTVLFAATGPAAHARALAGRRGRRGLSPREEDVYAQAGLAWIPPEIRTGTDEIAAAASGALPTLLEATDIRGDLHMHTTYSDGQDTLEAMVAASLALGYEYIAITDHSETAGASRTLHRDQVAQQRDEIARMRERYPQMAILHGVEVDILQNGRLDFDDALLEGFDIVLASLHDAARHDGAVLTRRCLQAIRHPLVNVITHPSNQLVGRRAGYALDYDAVYQAAAETGTALEVDGAPSHLDLDGEHARAAIAAGVTLTVDSDCHRAKALARQMRYGVGTARRGWVEARHVLNTRPLADVRAFIAAKRGR
jgi:DNA polymerase (family 10)